MTRARKKTMYLLKAHVCLKLLEPYLKNSYIVTTGNYFMSLNLAERLTQKLLQRYEIASIFFIKWPDIILVQVWESSLENRSLLQYYLHGWYQCLDHILQSIWEEHTSTTFRAETHITTLQVIQFDASRDAWRKIRRTSVPICMYQQINEKMAKKLKGLLWSKL